MPMALESRRPSRSLPLAWNGVIASASLLAAGLWTVWRARGPEKDSAYLLLDFLGGFVIAFGLMFAIRALVLVPRRRRSPRG